MGECLIIRSGGGTDTSNATATAGKVLSGYTCYVNDSKITGTMPNQGTKTASLNPGGSYTIQAGYHNGSGKISVNSLSSQTSATANAGRILSGRTAWVGGSKLTGTMTNRGAVSKALGANGSYTIPAGWHNGSGKVTQNLTKQAAVNVTPGTANKTACAANRWTTGNIVIVGSSNLKAANIKNGVTIFGVKGTFTGWVDSTCPVSVFGLSAISASKDWGSEGNYGSAASSPWNIGGIDVGKLLNSGFNWLHIDLYCWGYCGGSSTNTRTQHGIHAYYDESDGTRHSQSYYPTNSIISNGSIFLDSNHGRDRNTTVGVDIPLKGPADDNAGYWMAEITVSVRSYNRYVWAQTRTSNGWFKK